MTSKELEYAKKYKKISEVSEKECYLGGNCCGTCMYCTKAKLEPFCSHNCDTCEHGIPMEDQFYDDGSHIHECGLDSAEE